VTVLDARTDSTVPLRRNRDFNLLWLGEGVSLLGNSTTVVLLPLVAVVGFGAGPGWMGVLTASAWLPWLLIGLPAGAWVDNLPSRRVMIVSDLVAAGFIVSVPTAAMFGVLTLPQLAVVALGNGVCTVFFRAAYPALVRQLAPAEHQEQAFARLFGTESAMQVAGPGLGGLLAEIGSAVWGLLVDAVSFLVSAACLARIQLPSEKTDSPTRTTDPLGARIREGVRYVRNDRLILFFTVIGSISNFGLTGYATLMVIFMVEDLGLSPSSVGIVVALGSVGGFVGAAIATRVSTRLGSARAILWLQVLAGPPALLIALARPGWGITWLLLGTVLVGVGVVAGNVIRGAWRTNYVPRAMLARQITTAQVINYGTMPAAALIAGWLGSAVGVRETIAVMVLIHVVGCAGFWCSPIRGRRDMPRPVDHPREHAYS
jgi:MFS family permease